MGIFGAGAVVDEAVLDDWFYDFGDQVLAYLLHRSDERTAEDLLPDVFVLAACCGADPVAPVGVLFAIARSLLARRGVHPGSMLIERMAEDAAETEQLDVAERKFRFADALSLLGNADRDVLTVSGWYGLSSDEAAQALGCSTRAYRARLRRARTRLAGAVSADLRASELLS